MKDQGQFKTSLKRSLRRFPAIKATLRYIYGLTQAGFGLVDNDYKTISWTVFHDILWALRIDSIRERMTHNIVSIQWHHHDGFDEPEGLSQKEVTVERWKHLEERTKNNLDLYFSPQVKATDEVLELGSGIGAAARVIGPMCKSYTGIDVSKASVRASEFSCRDLSNVRFLWNNGTNLELIESESIDLIHCGGTFMHMDIIHVYGYFVEFERILRRGGRICISYPNIDRERWFKSFLKTASNQLFVPYSSLPSFRVRYLTSGTVQQMLDQMKFSDLRFFSKDDLTFRGGDISDTDHCWATK